MTGFAQMNELKELKRLEAEYRRRAKELVEAKLEYSWWCVDGYANILTRCIRDIERHERRCIKAYGDKAITFNAAITPPSPYEVQ